MNLCHSNDRGTLLGHTNPELRGGEQGCIMPDDYICKTSTEGMKELFGDTGPNSSTQVQGERGIQGVCEIGLLGDTGLQ